LCHPPLSGIDQGPRRIGYAAAMMLDRMMAGAAAPDTPVLFAPLNIVTRQSTDVMAVSDTDVATALRFIREHVHEAIQVSDVVACVPLSRRTLEQRFINQLGRSPSAEIQRVRLENCKKLLAETPWSLSRVAEAAGFNHSEVMIRAFRRGFGMTPSEYRRQARH
jgi:LacI family transcriptional regulator